MPELVAIKRALIGVSVKPGLTEFATPLHKEFSAEQVSTGGTAKFIRDKCLTLTDVAQVTGFPEIMDGRP